MLPKYPKGLEKSLIRIVQILELNNLHLVLVQNKFAFKKVFFWTCCKIIFQYRDGKGECKKPVSYLVIILFKVGITHGIYVNKLDYSAFVVAGSMV